MHMYIYIYVYIYIYSRSRCEDLPAKDGLSDIERS